MTPKAFKEKFQQAAIEAAAGTKIFPETILAAAGLESGYGKSALSRNYNNFFGIKWNAKLHAGLKSVTFPTKEQRKDGTWYTVNAPFVHFDSARQSFQFYIKFITGPRYIKSGVTDAGTPEEQFAAIKAGGYATDVNYAAKLTRIKNLFGTLSPVAAAAATGGLAILAIGAIFFF